MIYTVYTSFGLPFQNVCSGEIFTDPGLFLSHKMSATTVYVY